MCGIAGRFSTRNFSIESSLLRTLQKSLSHRGPDGFGYATKSDSENKFDTVFNDFNNINSNIFLWHSRLSIIDLSSNGNQPFRSSDFRFTVVFNGEIYNYLELREILTLKHNVEFHTQSDTEVLLNSFIVWGKSCVKNFKGMFAFVIYDTLNNSLFCSRDPFGIKPFYYLIDDDNFYFSSELESLKLLTQKAFSINQRYLSDFLNYGLSNNGVETIYDNIFQLNQGENLSLTKHENRLVTNFEVYHSFKCKQTNLKYGDAIVEAKSLLENSVKLHLRSDVKIGVALSGGVDSSTIATLIPNNISDLDKVTAISYVPSDLRYSEEFYIDAVLKKTKLKSIKFDIQENNISETLKDVIKFQGEPFNSPSILAQNFLFKFTNENGIKVLLDGQGGDELFGGYLQYLIPNLIESVNKLDFDRIYQTIKNFSKQNPNVGYKFLINGFIRNYLPSDFLKQHDSTKMSFHGVKLSLNNDSLVKRNGFSKMKEYLIYDISEGVLPRLLRYSDRNSMSHSVESRVPFLLTDISDFTLSLPSDFLINKQSVLKSLLRDVMVDYLPNELNIRRDKVGFATPISKYIYLLKHDIQKSFDNSLVNQIFDRDKVLNIIDNINTLSPKYDKSLIWRICCTILWMDANQNSIKRIL